MMYNQKFIATVKTDGKVLREFKDTIYIPYGSEYSVYLMNMNSVRAKVKVSIDGEDVLNGDDLVIAPNTSIELERFMETMDKGHKFKFIERSSEIESHRGLRAEDGLLRVEYTFEKVSAPIVNNYPPFNYPPGVRAFGVNDWGKPVLMAQTYDSYSPSNSSLFVSASAKSFSSSSVGITTKGSISTQQFQKVSDFTTDGVSHVMVLHLQGENQGKPVVTPIDVKRVQKCDCCGKVNPVSAKFCNSCGTSLEVLV
jgi:hypothetical protein